MTPGITFNIYVMSYQRPHKIMTKNCLEYCTYVVREEEADAYRNAGIDDMLVIPKDATLECGGKVHSFMSTLYWIIENTPEDVIFVADDDIKEKERVEMLTVRALSYLGELCVIEARNRPQEISWYDRSGNLRSSIGYAIIHNGKILEYSDFTQVQQGNEGVRKGKALIEELSKKFANGYALVVVAGMNYAEFVEAMENKNVLASAELFARKELPGMMSKLKKQLAS